MDAENKIGDKGAKALAEALEKNTSITSIECCNNSLGDGSAEALAEAIKVNSSITSIWLSEREIGDKGAKALAAALEKNSSITSFNLVQINIGYDGIKALAEAIKVNSSITSIWLCYNNIGDDGAEALAEAFEKNTAITSIELSASKIGDKGATALAAALKKNTSITSIVLSYNNIGDDGAKALTAALEKNTSITSINLYSNHIGYGNTEALENICNNNKDKFKILNKLISYNIGELDASKLSVYQIKKSVINVEEGDFSLAGIMLELLNNEFSISALKYHALQDEIIKTIPKALDYYLSGINNNQKSIEAFCAKNDVDIKQLHSAITVNWDAIWQYLKPTGYKNITMTDNFSDAQIEEIAPSGEHSDSEYYPEMA